MVNKLQALKKMKKQLESTRCCDLECKFDCPIYSKLTGCQFLKLLDKTNLQIKKEKYCKKCEKELK